MSFYDVTLIEYHKLTCIVSLTKTKIFIASESNKQRTMMMNLLVTIWPENREGNGREIEIASSDMCMYKTYISTIIHSILGYWESI